MDLKALSIVLFIDPTALLQERDRLWRTPLHIVAERAVKAEYFYSQPNCTSQIETVTQMGFDVHAKSGLGWTVLDHYMHKLGWHLNRPQGVHYRPFNSDSILNDVKYLVGIGVACHEPTAHRLNTLEVAVLLEPHLWTSGLPARPSEPDFKSKHSKTPKY